MKFDFCIGNPPYQGDNHMQLYPDFYQSAKEIADCVDLIFPIGWQEPKKANNLKKLNTTEVKEDRQIVFIDNRQNIFDGVTGAEWTNIIMWKRGYDNGLDGNQKLLTEGGDERIVHLETEKSIKIPDEMKSVLEKVRNNEEHPFTSFSSIVLRSESYRFTAKMHEDYPEIKDILSKGHLFDLKSSVLLNLSDIVFFDAPSNRNEYIRIMGLINSQRVTKWIKRKYIEGSSDFSKYKLFIAEAAAGGAFGEKLSEIIIAEPNVGHTQTFISVGAFETSDEAENTRKYVKSKFARALLFTLKTNQHNGKGTWANIPLQNFTNKSDINWTESISNIDKQLYKKYGLTKDEISFIESHVKEME